MDWDAGNVIKVLWKALEKYDYDPSRVHVSGYSRVSSSVPLQSQPGR